MARLAVNTSGKRGKNGQDASHTGYRWWGDDGLSGSDAQHGENAGDIHCHLSSVLKNSVPHLKVKVTTAKGTQIHVLSFKPDTKVDLYAIGGNGGIGGDGTDGKEGERGHNGSPGMSGSNGTDGGNGGRAGNAGNGGQIIISVHEDDLDLLACIGEIKNHPGKPGKGGYKGVGGRGGLGGRGGMANEDWQCGAHGITGRDGKDGVSGQYGKSGNNGSFCYRVFDKSSNHKDYASLHNIKISDCAFDGSFDRWFEPGQKVSVSKLTISNQSSMPFSGAQKTVIKMQENAWIKPVSGSLALNLTLKGASGGLSIPFSPMYFSVKEPESVAMGDPFKADTSLKFSATLSRVKKPLPSFSENSIKLQLRYPVELQKIHYPKVITSLNEAPFAFILKNVSNQDFGINSSTKRKIKVSINTDKVGDITCLPKVLTGSKAVMQWLDFPIGLLKAGSSELISGTIKFNPNLSNISKRIKVTLFLGSPEGKGPDLRAIQSRVMSLQLTQSYHYNPKADFLLVINDQTDMSIVNTWIRLIRSMDSDAAVWNVSYYGGFDLRYKFPDRHSLLKDFRNKSVVIFNHQSSKGGMTINYINDSSLYDLFAKANANTLTSSNGNISKKTQHGALDFLGYKAPNFYASIDGIAGLINTLRAWTGARYENNFQKLIQDPGLNAITPLSEATISQGDPLKDGLINTIKTTPTSEFSFTSSCRGKFGFYSKPPCNFNVKVTETYYSRLPREEDIVNIAKKWIPQIKKYVPDRGFILVYNFNPKLLKQKRLGAIYSLGTVLLVWRLQGNRNYMKTFHSFYQKDESKVRAALFSILPFSSKLEKFEYIASAAPGEIGLEPLVAAASVTLDCEAATISSTAGVDIPNAPVSPGTADIACSFKGQDKEDLCSDFIKSILRDLVDEQAPFRSNEVRNVLSSDELISHLPRLNQFFNYDYSKISKTNERKSILGCLILLKRYAHLYLGVFSWLKNNGSAVPLKNYMVSNCDRLIKKYCNDNDLVRQAKKKVSGSKEICAYVKSIGRSMSYSVVSKKSYDHFRQQEGAVKASITESKYSFFKSGRPDLLKRSQAILEYESLAQNETSTVSMSTSSSRSNVLLPSAPPLTDSLEINSSECSLKTGFKIQV